MFWELSFAAPEVGAPLLRRPGLPAPSLPAGLFWVSPSRGAGGSLGFGVAQQRAENGCKWPCVGPAAALLEGFEKPAITL